VIESCASAGVVVKCGDAIVRKNTFRDCPSRSLAVAAGAGSIVENNRIIDCNEGIRVSGIGHTIRNNCIIRCSSFAVRVSEGGTADAVPGLNIIIDGNACINFGIKRSATDITGSGVLIDPRTSCVISGNLFYGAGTPYAFVNDDGAEAATAKSPRAASRTFLAQKNICAGGCIALDGCSEERIEFVSERDDDYRHDSASEALALALRGHFDDETVLSSTDADEPAPDDDDQKHAGADAVDQVIEEAEQKELRLRSLFFPDDYPRKNTPCG
jgi:hypothetical protein